MLSFLVTRCALGMATGWAVLAAFMVLDVASLRTLMAQTGSTVPALALLGVFFAITFGSCAMGLGIMFETGRDEEKPPRGGRRGRLPPLFGPPPARARVRAVAGDASRFDRRR